MISNTRLADSILIDRFQVKDLNLHTSCSWTLSYLHSPSACSISKGLNVCSI